MAAEVPPAPPPPRVPRWLDRLAAIAWRVLVVAAAIAVAVYVLIRLRLVVLPVIVALLLATILSFPAAWLKRRGWRPALAATTVFVAGLVLIGGVITAVVPVVAGELDDLAESVGEGIEEVETWLRDGPLALSDAQLRRATDRLGEQARENAGRLAGGALTGASMAVEVLAGILLTAVILFFFLKDGERIAGWFVDRAPPDRRRLLTDLGRRAWRTLQGYIGGTAIVGIVDAVVTGIGLVILGVPLVVPLMVLFFFAPYFPYVGAIAAGVITVLVALVAEGVGTAVLAGIVVLAVQQLESNLLQPIILGKSVRLHPLVVLLSLTAGAVLGGITGAFLAVPVAGVAAAVGNELRLRAEEV